MKFMLTGRSPSGRRTMKELELSGRSHQLCDLRKQSKAMPTAKHGGGSVSGHGSSFKIMIWKECLKMRREWIWRKRLTFLKIPATSPGLSSFETSVERPGTVRRTWNRRELDRFDQVVWTKQTQKLLQKGLECSYYRLRLCCKILGNGPNIFINAIFMFYAVLGLLLLHFKS